MNIDSHTYFCNFNRYNKNNIIKIDDVIGIAQYLADKQNFLYIYLFSWTNEILLFLLYYVLPFHFVFVLS